MTEARYPRALLPWTITLLSLLVTAALAGVLALSPRNEGRTGSPEKKPDRPDRGEESDLIKSSYVKLLERRARELEERERDLRKKAENYKKMLMEEIAAHIADSREKDAIIRQRDAVIEELDRALADRVRSIQELRVANEDLQRQVLEKDVRCTLAEQEIKLLQEMLHRASAEE